MSSRVASGKRGAFIWRQLNGKLASPRLGNGLLMRQRNNGVLNGRAIIGRPAMSMAVTHDAMSCYDALRRLWSIISMAADTLLTRPAR